MVVVYKFTIHATEKRPRNGGSDFLTEMAES